MAKSTAKNYTPDQLSAMNAEEFLTVGGVEVLKSPSGNMTVSKNFSCDNLELEKLPDLTQVVFEGSFSCSGNKLKTLAGAPRKIGGNFEASNNLLETLEGAPEEVGGGFNCMWNQLISLKGCPKIIPQIFACCHNKLETLEHVPDEVGGDVMISGNPLTKFLSLPSKLRRLELDEKQMSLFEQEWDAANLTDKTLFLVENHGAYYVPPGSVSELSLAMRRRENTLELARQNAEHAAREAAEYQHTLTILRQNRPAIKFQLKR